MNALITFNFRDYMVGKARNSFQHAAARWKCEYIEVTEQLRHPSGRKLHHWWQKVLLYDGIASPFDRVAVLDADILIRIDCPSLFDVVPDDQIGAVSRIQPGMPLRKNPDKDLVYHGERLGMQYPTKDRHLNGGLVVYSPARHREYMEAWRCAGETEKWAVRHATDQGALSVVLHHMNAPVYWLPYQYNALRAWSRPRDMNCYIYHFTKFKPVKEHILQTKWRCTGPIAP